MGNPGLPHNLGLSKNTIAEIVKRKRGEWPGANSLKVLGSFRLG
jgi:hypothetical protein